MCPEACESAVGLCRFSGITSSQQDFRQQRSVFSTWLPSSSSNSRRTSGQFWRQDFFRRGNLRSDYSGSAGFACESSPASVHIRSEPAQEVECQTFAWSTPYNRISNLDERITNRGLRSNSELNGIACRDSRWCASWVIGYSNSPCQRF